MKTFAKRSLALLLTVMMLLSVMAVGITSVSAANIPSGTTLYLKPACWQAENARFAAYFFNGGTNAWADATVRSDDATTYAVTAPAGEWTNVIFCRMNSATAENNWDNKWNQTADLEFDGTNNCFVISDWEDSKGHCPGTWTTYTEKNVYFVNTRGWETVYGYGTTPGIGSNTAWPGKTATLVDSASAVYSFNPGDRTQVCFNPGTSSDEHTSYFACSDVYGKYIEPKTNAVYNTAQEAWDAANACIEPSTTATTATNATLTTSPTASSSFKLSRVYFDNADTQWNSVYIYSWSNGCIGTYALTKVTGTDYWYFDFPQAMPVGASFLFASSPSLANQTGEVFVTEPYNCINGSTNKWSTYTDATTEPAEEQYCLVGHIDGVDVGFEGDSATITNKFVDNKITLTFAKESYVFVKDTTNTNWYMFNSYCTDTKGTLYNTSSGSSEKMGVPAGTHTFTIAKNSDGTLTLSYTTEAAATTASTTTPTTAATQATYETVVYTSQYFPACASSYTTLNEALQSIKVDNSKSNRAKIATVNGITNYTYTAEQNNQMLALLKSGKLVNPDYVPTSTEAPETSYYLVGYINGKDVDVEGNHTFDNNGQITLNLTEKSYFYIKDSNGNSYMTKGWAGEDISSVDLYNTAVSSSIEWNKLCVPAGKCTLTAVKHSSGYFTLSYKLQTEATTVATTAPTTATTAVAKYFPACASSYTTLYSALASVGYPDVTWEFHCQIAELNGITDFEGTAVQNTQLLNLLKAGTLLNPEYVETTPTGYCLVGNIDGKDVGCGNDWETTVNKLDSKNQITLTFTQDSYVYLKNITNTKWYMTQGWEGNVSKAVLYPTDSTALPSGVEWDKLWVPAGTHTFTAVENSNGTITLSYTKATAVTTTVAPTTATTVIFDGKSKYFPACSSSITGFYDGLIAIGVSGTYTNREKIAVFNGITNYTGTTAQNNQLLDLLKSGKLLNPDYVEATTKATTAATTKATTATAGDGKYCVVGYINGADVGCEDDHASIVNVMDSNNQITLTFSEESYVFLKTKDNEDWFMTLDWLGEVQSAMLFNTKTNLPGDMKFDKLWVPAGTFKFTATEQPDGSILLSYTAAEDDTTPTEATYETNKYVTKYFPACSTSVSTFNEGLKAIGVDNSKENRTRIAYCNGMTNYTYTAEQNNILLALLKNGQLLNPDYPGAATVATTKATENPNGKYSIVGYIDGANRGCEDDYASVINVMDENNKITLTFEKESYVFLKTVDNKNWYMTLGWLGYVSSAMLYHTDNTALPDGVAWNKLWVPAGTHTFTATEQSDGTVMLSYVKASSITTTATQPTTQAPTATGNPIVGNDSTLFLDPKDWEKDGARFAAYFFNTSGGKQWVGMEDSNGDGLYEVQIPSGVWTYVIFCRMKADSSLNNWAYVWNQTIDLELNKPYNCFTITGPWDDEGATGKWSVVSITPPETTKPSETTPTATKPSETVTTSPTLPSDVPEDGYCLVGNINGASIGDGDNWNKVVNVFYNNKVTLTITKDSYVYLKDTKCTTAYMTMGWQGYDVTAARFYNTSTTTLPEGVNWDKLYVPAGTFTFVITTLEDGSILLSYTGEYAPTQPTTTPTETQGGTTPSVKPTETQDVTDATTPNSAYFPACAASHTSFVAALNSLGIESTKFNRVKIAAVNGITPYTGSAAQNDKLLELLKQGKLINPDYIGSDDYCLVGFINGQDVGIGDNISKVVNEFDQNNKITLTFDQTSYVCLKDTTCTTTYMTMGWLGDVTEAIFYNTSTTTLPEGMVWDKLFVPAGTFTFTVKKNSDGTLYLTYTGVQATTAKATEATETTKATENNKPVGYFPACSSTYTSLIAALQSKGIDSSKEYRTKIAKANGIENYTYTAEQNTYLLNLFKEGKLINPDYEFVEGYCLVGSIDGVNVGCDDDWGKVVNLMDNNRITLTFNKDSYIYLKDTACTTAYMTQGWLGQDVPQAILYNTNTTKLPEGKSWDKLFVPAGTFTFVATPQKDGTIIISYTGTPAPTEKPTESAKPTTPAPTGKKLYLVPDENWLANDARFAAYFFTDKTNAWVSMTDADKDGIYEVTVPDGDWTKVIFCSMKGASTENNWDNKLFQTDDLEIQANKNCFTVTDNNGEWSKFDPVDAPTVPTDDTSATDSPTAPSVSQSYCLVGYINGKNVGCDDEWNKIVNVLDQKGQITLTFTDVSYVYIKDTACKTAYMTIGYAGQVSKATLYNTTTTTLPEGKNFDKLYVPVGTYTFTAVEKDGNIQLSYVKVDDSTEPTKPTEATKKPAINSTLKSMKAGQTFTVKVSNTNGEKVTFKSSKKKVAKVDANGKVTALKKGVATITATVGNTTLTCKIDVTTNPTLSKTNVTVNRGKTVKIKINGKVKSIDNKYKNTKKATVISKTSAKKIKVKGLTKGTTTLKIKVNGVKNLKLKVTVK